MERQQARDLRTVEISYVLVSSAAVVALLAAAYWALLGRVGPDWRDHLHALALPGAAVVVAFLALRGLRLLRSLERNLGVRREPQPQRDRANRP